MKTKKKVQLIGLGVGFLAGATYSYSHSIGMSPGLFLIGCLTSIPGFFIGTIIGSGENKT